MNFRRLRTVQLCAHCRRRKAAYWVSMPDQVSRRPWCPPCVVVSMPHDARAESIER